MNIIYKLSYTREEMQQYFYPLIISQYDGNQVYTEDDYIKSVNQLLFENMNSYKVAAIMTSMFNDGSALRNIRPVDKVNIKESRKELFASLYYIPPKIFKQWLRSPQINIKIMLAIKYFLIYGQTSFDIKPYQINDYLFTNKSKLEIKYYNDLYLIDGDNLYSHILPLFNLNVIGGFIVFYKRSNISPFFAAQLSMDQKENINVIQTEQSKKDAADMSICRYLTMITANRDNIRQNQRAHIISGDEASQEIIRMTNSYLQFEYVDRINSQLIGPNKSFWDISDYINYFPRKNYGDLIFKTEMSNLPIRSNINYFNFKDYLSGNYSNTNSDNVIVSPWIIILMKRFNNIITELHVERIIKIFNIKSFADFLNYLDNNNFSTNDIFDYKDQLLKIIGAKFFTIQELVDKFLYNHIRLITEIKKILIKRNIKTIDVELISRISKLTPDTDYIYLLELVREFISLYPDNTNFLRIYYKFINPIELYINYIDFNIALGIEDIQVDVYNKLTIDENPDINLLKNIQYFPERIYVKTITFKL